SGMSNRATARKIRRADPTTAIKDPNSAVIRYVPQNAQPRGTRAHALAAGNPLPPGPAELGTREADVDADQNQLISCSSAPVAPPQMRGRRRPPHGSPPGAWYIGSERMRSATRSVAGMSTRPRARDEIGVSSTCSASATSASCNRGVLGGQVDGGHPTLCASALHNRRSPRLL